MDTVFLMSKEVTCTIYRTTHGVEGRGGPFFDDVNKDLSAFTISIGEQHSTKNYLSNDSWLYDNGEYKTTVTNSDF